MSAIFSARFLQSLSLWLYCIRNIVFPPLAPLIHHFRFLSSAAISVLFYVYVRKNIINVEAKYRKEKCPSYSVVFITDHEFFLLPFFSDISERNNDYSDTLDFRRGWVGEDVTFFVSKVPDYKSAMLIYLYICGRAHKNQESIQNQHFSLSTKNYCLTFPLSPLQISEQKNPH